MTFYVAVIVYEFSSNAPQYQPLYREDFVLIKAFSEEDAQMKALQKAKLEETFYNNEKGEKINIILKKVVDVQPILSENFENGTDIYTRHFYNYQAYNSFELLSSEEI
ncbi:DUF4288 domain-containing protein [Tengunoibacter tsumagoiensis]|uniref:DUF4288 domain-containing protein n=1 Tax=Tengunoibacter tsumagoiensis TaxID=2014871 RepID=A0A401ZZB9_9CHLR|nr:DUF4288 domain-containing protein [Tengunoibacter tsumagoiensis]GCE12197.1 hypothetical protein KTT_20560 [Tengunoibacter tsumagoiensis]